MTRRLIISANFTMKTNYKTTIAIVAISAVIASGIFSGNAFAVIRVNFCSNPLQTISLLDQRIIVREEMLKTSQNERLQNLKNSREFRDAKLTELKQTVSTNLATTYAKIEVLAKTNEQKTAVSNFKTAMENAINARKNTIVTAASNYRQEIDNIIVSRNSAIDTTVRNFKNSYQSAIQNAKTNCTAGVKPLLARTNFVAEISAAKSNLISAKQKMASPASLVKSSSANYKNAVTKSNQDFKTAAEKARVELKASFGR